jgi:hypothetical protein
MIFKAKPAGTATAGQLRPSMRVKNKDEMARSVTWMESGTATRTRPLHRICTGSSFFQKWKHVPSWLRASREGSFMLLFLVLFSSLLSFSLLALNPAIPSPPVPIQFYSADAVQAAARHDAPQSQVVTTCNEAGRVQITKTTSQYQVGKRSRRAAARRGAGTNWTGAEAGTWTKLGWLGGSLGCLPFWLPARCPVGPRS